MDIIKAALDNLGHEVSLTIRDTSALGGKRVKRATITGLHSTDSAPYITVENYRDPYPHGITIPKTLVGIHELVEIRYP